MSSHTDPCGKIRKVLGQWGPADHPTSLLKEISYMKKALSPELLMLQKKLKMIGVLIIT